MVEEKRGEVARLCEKYGVERLELFGSASRDGERFDPGESDLDFVVSFEQREPKDLFGRYFGLAEELETLFGRKVDLVSAGALAKDHVFEESISEERLTIYAT